jgi:GTP cyclohydrolase FolE2
MATNLMAMVEVAVVVEEVVAVAQAEVTRMAAAKVVAKVVVGTVLCPCAMTSQGEIARGHTATTNTKVDFAR